MAVTKGQLSLIVLWFSLSGQLLFVATIPVPDGGSPFSYEHFGSGYFNNSRQTWNFTTDNGAHLLLTFMEIETERFFDYITVGEGITPTPESQVLMWSGQRVDDELLYLSSGNALWLTFQTDSSVTKKGFYFTVEKVPSSYKLPCPQHLRCEEQVCLTRHDICDGVPNCADGFDEKCSEQISVTTTESVQRSFIDSHYGTNHKFTWIFLSSPDTRIQLTFDHINTEPHYDFVTVGNGRVASKNLLLTFSGEEDGQFPHVISSNDAMWMTLSTDGSKLSNRGFSAQLRQIDKVNDDTCDGDTFDCMNGVCLPSRYRCDNIAQCGTGSDENLQICPDSCPVSKMCMDGRCFEESEKCNQKIDCINSFDEYGCPLPVELGHFKQTFDNHSREINFRAEQGKRVLLTLYLPQREVGNSTITVTEGSTRRYSLTGTPSPGFYRFTSSSTSLTLNFRTDSDIAVSAVPVNSTFKYCPDGFQCSDGLQCIPYALSCDGIEHCQDKSDESPNVCRDPCVINSETCTVEVINEGLQNENLTAKDVVIYAGILEAIVNEAPPDSGNTVNLIVSSMAAIVESDTAGGATDSIINVVNDLHNAEAGAISDSSNVGVVPTLLENQIGNAVASKGSYSELTLENVRATASEVDGSALQAPTITYGTAFAAKTSREQLTSLANFAPPDFINATEATNVSLSQSITLTRSLLRRYSTGGSSTPLTLISYRDGSIFPNSSVERNGTKTVKKTISSQIISANIRGQEVKNLPTEDRVVMKFFSFPVASKCETQGAPECVFWKYDESTKQGEWSTEGCRTETSDDEQVTCICDHLTSFGVLVHLSRDAIPENVALNIIADIGCVLSIIGLLICVIVIFALKDLRGKQSYLVHANLCFALIGFYLTFLIGIELTSNPVVCRILSSFIHFFCLSSMAWMSVEAVLLYHLVYKAQQGDVKHLLPVGIALAWGVPLLVAIVVGIINPHDYECTPDYCFLHPDLGMYIGFLLLIVIMFVFNTTAFFMVSCKLSCLKIMTQDAAKKRKEIESRVKRVVFFWLLLGMSWAFGLLAAIPNTSFLKIIFEIIFSLLLASQGFAMFYLLIINNQKLSKKLNCCGNNLSLFSRSRSTTKTTQGSHKSSSKNDQTGNSSAAEADTTQSQSQSAYSTADA